MSRHVRLVITGDAHDVGGSGVLRVRYGPTASVMVDPSLPSVTVEDVAPTREWREGDVVAGDVLVYRRGLHTWVAVSADGASVYRASDASITAAVDAPAPDDDRLTVLRYQAGDQ